MSRDRLYANNAERQKAYRRRQAEPPQEPLAPARPRRRPSRPARLVAALAELQNLRGEYDDWLGGLPESLADGHQADVLNEAIDQLQAIIDQILELQLPRGFGRD